MSSLIIVWLLTKSRSLSLTFFLSTTRYCLFTYLANCFAFICGTDVEVSLHSTRTVCHISHTTKNQFQRVQFCTHAAGTRNDPLLYWKNNEQSKPLLAKLARRFLCAPPGSVPSERLFSTAGDIADGKRNRLLPEKVEMILFLNKNLLLLNFDY